MEDNNKKKDRVIDDLFSEDDVPGLDELLATLDDEDEQAPSDDSTAETEETDYVTYTTYDKDYKPVRIKRPRKEYDDIVAECEANDATWEDEQYSRYYESDKLQMLFIDYAGLAQYFGHDSIVVVPDGVLDIQPGAFIHNHHLTSVVLPDTVEEIGDYAFFRCSGLRDVRFSENLKRIGKRAFMKCDTEEFIADLPDSVEFIDEQAFVCVGIEKLPRNLQHVGTRAFYGCIWDLFDEQEEPTEWLAEIPSQVTNIGDYAFCEVSLGKNCKGMKIPLSVKKIGKHAFGRRYKDDARNYTLYYEGSEEQWKEIEIDNTDDWLKDIVVKFNCKSTA